jgi:hypothetical protein
MNSFFLLNFNKLFKTFPTLRTFKVAAANSFSFNLITNFKKNYFIFLILNNSFKVSNIGVNPQLLISLTGLNLTNFVKNLTKNFNEGFYYLRGFFIILFVDAAITDDEPL